MGYKLAGRQGARVEEPLMGNCTSSSSMCGNPQAVKAATTPPTYRGLAAKGLIRKDTSTTR